MDLEVGGPASGLEATNKQHSALLRQGFGGQAKRIALDNSSILFNRPSFMNGCGNRVLNYPLFYPLLGVIPFLRQGAPGRGPNTPWSSPQFSDPRGKPRPYYHPNRYFSSRPPKKAMEMLVNVPIR